MLKPALESSLNRHSFEQELRLALDAAQANYSRALREFQQIISEVPSGLTSPDGKFRVERAASACCMAFENYMAAMKRFSDFTLGRDR